MIILTRCPYSEVNAQADRHSSEGATAGSKDRNERVGTLEEKINPNQLVQFENI